MPMGQMQKTVKIDVTTSKDLWPYTVMNEIQKRMEYGVGRHPHGDSWEKSPRVLIDRAIKHLRLLVDGDKSDDHLAAAFSDLMMAMAIERGYLDTMDAFFDVSGEDRDA